MTSSDRETHAAHLSLGRVVGRRMRELRIARSWSRVELASRRLSAWRRRRPTPPVSAAPSSSSARVLYDQPHPRS